MKYLIRNINNYKIDEIETFYDYIYETKKNRISKYKNEIVRTRSIIGEIILSELLSKEKIDYKTLKFQTNEYGKPYIEGKNIYYNISHSHDYVIVAISNKEIGIDIEKIRKNPTSIINQIATDNEKAYILADSENTNKRLFEIFTLKEAYFKMLGKNLNNILNIEFSIKGNSIICTDPNIHSEFITDIPGYVISFCEKKD